MKNQVIMFAVVGVVVGLAVGYYFGTMGGKKAGYEAGVAAGVSQEKKAQADQDAANAVPKFVNPAEKLPETNPFEGVKTNPFEGVKYVNPFK